MVTDHSPPIDDSRDGDPPESTPIPPEPGRVPHGGEGPPKWPPFPPEPGRVPWGEGKESRKELPRLTLPARLTVSLPITVKQLAGMLNAKEYLVIAALYFRCKAVVRINDVIPEDLLCRFGAEHDCEIIVE